MAQQRYTDYVLAALPPPEPGPVRVLDVGCGTGHVLAQLRRRGYAADGLVPSASLAELVRRRLAEHPEARLFQCRFEDFPAEAHAGTYDCALFSESFQYIPVAASLRQLGTILRPGGRVVICDFFRRKVDPQTPGYRSFGGGHDLEAFTRAVAESPFAVLRDEDITPRIAPTIALLDEVLMGRLVPAGRTLHRYLTDRHPWAYGAARGLARLFLGRRLARLRYKYFSGHRSQAVFQRFKSYRLVVLEHRP